MSLISNTEWRHHHLLTVNIIVDIIELTILYRIRQRSPTNLFIIKVHNIIIICLISVQLIIKTFHRVGPAQQGREGLIYRLYQQPLTSLSYKSNPILSISSTFVEFKVLFSVILLLFRFTFLYCFLNYVLKIL